MPAPIQIQFAVLATGLALASAAPAQQVRQQPLGFVLDGGSSRVRPLLGVPGAAIVGDPLDLGVDISASAVSPDQQFLVVLSGPTHNAGIWKTGEKTVQSLANVKPGATQVVLSPEGLSAAFYFADMNRVQVVTGLPSSPATAFEADLSAMMNPLSSLAVSDDGALLMAAEAFVDGNATPAVAVFNAKGVAGRIATVGAASAIAFLSNSHDALVSAASESVLIRDAAAQANRTLLPTAVNASAAVLASSDGSRAFFARTQTGSVSILSLKAPGNPALVVNCDCTPAGISRTASASIYRLTENFNAPVALLDASALDVAAGQPRLLVIPPVVKSVSTPDNQ